MRIRLKDLYFFNILLSRLNISADILWYFCWYTNIFCTFAFTIYWYWLVVFNIWSRILSKWWLSKSWWTGREQKSQYRIHWWRRWWKQYSRSRVWKQHDGAQFKISLTETVFLRLQKYLCGILQKSFVEDIMFRGGSGDWQYAAKANCPVATVHGAPKDCKSGFYEGHEQFRREDRVEGNWTNWISSRGVQDGLKKRDRASVGFRGYEGAGNSTARAVFGSGTAGLGFNYEEDFMMFL